MDPHKCVFQKIPTACQRIVQTEAMGHLPPLDHPVRIMCSAFANLRALVI